MKDCMGAYIASIKNYELLEEPEIRKLIVKAQNGNYKARNTIIKHNLKLVPFVARRYTNAHFSNIELISEGNLGLFDAIRLFDLTRDTKFSTYAYIHIRKRMSRYIDNNANNIHIPVWVNEIIRTMHHKVSNGEELNYEEELKYAIGNSEVSINCSVSNESDQEIVDYLGKNDIDLQRTCAKIDIQTLLGFLTINEQDIITRRMDGETLREIGKIYDLSRTRIMQIEAKAMKKLVRKITLLPLLN